MNAQSLQTWKRESLIDWLSRNDKNGIYTDAEAEPKQNHVHNKIIQHRE